MLVLEPETEGVVPVDELPDDELPGEDSVVGDAEGEGDTVLPVPGEVSGGGFEFGLGNVGVEITGGTG